MKIKGKKNLTNFIYLSLAAVFFLGLVFCFAQPVEMEFGAYSAYPRSLLLDGDLNIVNQLPKEATWIISPTLSAPSYFDHGHSLLWLPFVAYEKIVYWLFPNDALKIQFSNFTFAIMGAFFSFLSFLLLKNISFIEPRDNLKKIFLSLVGIFPMIFCLIFSPSNADITAMLAASLFLYILGSLKKEQSSTILIGLFTALILTIKINLYFYLPFLLLWINQFPGRKEKIKQCVLIFFSAIFIMIPYITNSILKYGHWEWPYRWFAETSTQFILGITLWGEAGYLQQTPGIILIVICSSLLFLFNYKKEDRFTRWFIGLSLFTISIETLIFSKRFFMTQLSYPLARNVVFFLPLFFVLLNLIFKSLKNQSRLHGLFNILIVLAAIWSMGFQFSLYHYENELIKWEQVFSPQDYLSIWKNIIHHFYLLKSHFYDFILLYALYLPLIAFCFLLYYGFKSSLHNSPKLIPRIILALSISYAAITVLNVMNHTKNTDRWLKEGCYQNQSIGKNSKVYSFDELNDITALSKNYYNRTSNKELISAIETWEKKYLENLDNDFLFDPMNNAEKIRSQTKTSYLPQSQTYWKNFLVEGQSNSFCRRI